MNTKRLNIDGLWVTIEYETDESGSPEIKYFLIPAGDGKLIYFSGFDDKFYIKAEKQLADIVANGHEEREIETSGGLKVLVVFGMLPEDIPTPEIEYIIHGESDISNDIAESEWVKLNERLAALLEKEAREDLKNRY